MQIVLIDPLTADGSIWRDIMRNSNTLQTDKYPSNEVKTSQGTEYSVEIRRNW